jgi:hypothetical protein
MEWRFLMWKRPAPVALLMFWSFLSAQAVSAQALPLPEAPAGQTASARIRWELAGGPAVEVATPGERERQRGVLAVPSLSIAVASWFEFVVEGHAVRHVSPVGGYVLGFVPIGWRIHSRGRTQPYLAAGAGVAWTDLTGLRGVEQRRNYLTQIGAGLRRERANGSAVFVEARFFHLSNLSSAPPNLGMEVFAVLVGYRLPG